MTSLRMRVVEAGARAIEAEAKKWPREDHPLGWGTRTPPPGASMADLSQAALDAMLDCLAENAEASRSVRYLARVLRETTPPTEEE